MSEPDVSSYWTTRLKLIGSRFRPKRRGGTRGILTLASTLIPIRTKRSIGPSNSRACTATQTVGLLKYLNPGRTGSYQRLLTRS